MWKDKQKKLNGWRRETVFGLTTTASLNIFLGRLSRREYLFQWENLILYNFAGLPDICLPSKLPLPVLQMTFSLSYLSDRFSGTFQLFFSKDFGTSKKLSICCFLISFEKSFEMWNRRWPSPSPVAFLSKCHQCPVLAKATKSYPSDPAKRFHL